MNEERKGCSLPLSRCASMPATVLVWKWTRASAMGAPCSAAVTACPASWMPGRRRCRSAEVAGARPGQLPVRVPDVHVLQAALVLGGLEESGHAGAQVVRRRSQVNEAVCAPQLLWMLLRCPGCAAHADLPYWQHVVVGGRHIDKLIGYA